MWAVIIRILDHLGDGDYGRRCRGFAMKQAIIKTRKQQQHLDLDAAISVSSCFKLKLFCCYYTAAFGKCVINIFLKDHLISNIDPVSLSLSQVSLSL